MGIFSIHASYWGRSGGHLDNHVVLNYSADLEFVKKLDETVYRWIMRKTLNIRYWFGNHHWSDMLDKNRDLK